MVGELELHRFSDWERVLMLLVGISLGKGVNWWVSRGKFCCSSMLENSFVAFYEGYGVTGKVSLFSSRILQYGGSVCTNRNILL